LRAKQLTTRVPRLFAAISFGRRALVSNRPTYVDAKLEHLVSGLRDPDNVGLKELAELLEKLKALSKTLRLAWKEPPWTHVLGAVKESASSRPSLGQEASSIKILEGQELIPITVSAFQHHILRRIELQAKLVERVGLGRSVNISTEIRYRLSLVWAMISNDEFDTGHLFTPVSHNRPDNRPDRRPDEESGNRPKNGPDDQFDTDAFPTPISQNKPDNGSGSRPNDEPDNRPPIQPADRPPTQPANRPPTQPDNRPPTQPANQRPIQPTNRSDEGSGSRPTTFNKRNGTRVFRIPTRAQNWTSLVNVWHQKVFGGLPVEYMSVRAPGSPDHQPQWIVTPIILGELNPDYRATGPTKMRAAEESARLIAASGHC
ncbi:unnamed protein product, partial [Rhizoctonia solani]